VLRLLRTGVPAYPGGGEDVMATPRADERFWRTTRGQIVSRLRRSGRTVGELAKALDVTGNAIRAALATLERDGLVQPGARRPGVRKPNQQKVVMGWNDRRVMVAEWDAAAVDRHLGLA
jgi:DNA-binding transcriptional ArsR family regulator